MAADLYKMQDDQRFPEIWIDKLEFVEVFGSRHVHSIAHVLEL